MTIEKNLFPTCLRCGKCCIEYSLILPGRLIKPAGSECPHLAPVRIEENQWIEATCLIHEDKHYPQVCQKFILGFENFCTNGIMVWKNRKKKHPNIKLPQLVEKAINASTEQFRLRLFYFL